MQIRSKYEKREQFEVSGKSLESLETGDSVFSVNCVLWKGPGVVFLGEK
jgi:hypothetical protein